MPQEITLSVMPWERLTTIASLAESCSSRLPQFGKTALQKSVYLLQDIYEVDVGYRFGLHTYGPFCAELLGDLDFAESLGLVQTKRSASGDWGYNILPCNRTSYKRRTRQEFQIKLSEGLSRLFSDFGGCSAEDLELYSTIIFVDREFQRNQRVVSSKEFVELIRQIKPKFSSADVTEAEKLLVEKGYISRRESSL